MFYHALGAVPAWAPAGEDHILYSSGVLRDVVYNDTGVSYYAAEITGNERLRVSFKPRVIASKCNYTTQELSSGDYYLVIERRAAGTVRIERAQNTGGRDFSH